MEGKVGSDFASGSRISIGGRGDPCRRGEYNPHMTRGIFLIEDGGKLVEMREEAYDSEDLLQGFLARYPNLLAGDQVDPTQPRRWLLITREASVPDELGGGGRWSVDHLFLDQDAVPTLVEVKRASDTRIRREVVGQMLDYAANAVVYWPVEHLQAAFEATCRKRNLDPDTELTNWLGPDKKPSTFWQEAKTNLQAGKVRLLFVADQIPTELRRIVEFLNVQMDPAEVLAIEIKQFTSSGLRTLVPTVIGQTVEAQQRKRVGGPQRRQGDEGSYFDMLAGKVSPAEVEVARRILEWSTRKGMRIWWGPGTQSASYIPVFHHGDTDYQLFAVYTTGSVEIVFQYYRTKPPFDAHEKRIELRNRLNAIPGISIPDDAIGRRPSVRLSALVPDKSLRGFLGVFDWFEDEVIKS